MNGSSGSQGRQILLLALRPEKSNGIIKIRILSAQFCFKINDNHTDIFQIKSKQVSDRVANMKETRLDLNSMTVKIFQASCIFTNRDWFFLCCKKLGITEFLGWKRTLKPLCPTIKYQYQEYLAISG